jgi:hypothetical protein
MCGVDPLGSCDRRVSTADQSVGRAYGAALGQRAGIRSKVMLGWAVANGLEAALI